MTEIDPCAFCDIESLSDRTIRIGVHTVSILSKPAYRPGQALVIPMRHISTLEDLQPAESIELLREAGRIASLLDAGYGAEIHQKYAPKQPKNGIKMEHLHIHVVPKFETDAVFALPQSFDDFYVPTDDEIDEYLHILR